MDAVRKVGRVDGERVLARGSTNLRVSAKDASNAAAIEQCECVSRNAVEYKNSEDGLDLSIEIGHVVVPSEPV